MNLVEKALQELERRIEGSGVEDGHVNLRVDPGADTCNYEHGACMVATFGGRSADFVTHQPTRAETRLRFMFGPRADNDTIRAAICAVINSVTGFLCINRVRHSCARDCRGPCLEELREALKGEKVGILGDSPVLLREFSHQVRKNIDDADRILVMGQGLESGIELPDGTDGKVLCIGPSTSGVASLHNIPHWCPYGRA